MVSFKLRFRLFATILISPLLGAVPALAQQVPPTLDKGHRILLQRGLQIQAQCFIDGSWTWTLGKWNQSNFTTVNWQTDVHVSRLGPAPGIPWGRWTGTTNFGSSYVAPTAEEQSYASNYISLQLGDEQNLNNWNTDSLLRNNTIAWFNAARPNFPNTLLFLNQQGNEPTATSLAAYMADARPDMLMYDSYPISRFITITGGSLKTLYEDMAKFRTVALAGNDGTGRRPIPFGHYTENFTDNNFWPRFASESEIRLQQFAAWTFGEKLVSAFVYNSVSNVQSQFFTGLGDTSPTPAFYQMAESNRQSRNLGDTLVRLLTRDVRFVPGQNASGANPTPTGMQNWAAGAIPHLATISAVNLGTRNGGRKGDVLVGRFNVLDESFDGPLFSDETYFMITNGLTDASGTAAQTRQEITIDFDLAGTGITSLLRRSRDTGLVETVPLTYLGGSMYRLVLGLDGGTGDLFKFNNGAVFVVPEPSVASLAATAALLLLFRRGKRSQPG